jgi:multidrug efflux pump subunit AcrB
MPQGTPAAVTSDAVRRIEAGAERLRQDLLATTGTDYYRQVFASVGDQPMASRVGMLAMPLNSGGGHLGEVTIELAQADERVINSEELGNRWRETVGPIPEAVEISFNASAMNAGEDINVMFVGPDLEVLRNAAEEVKRELDGFAGVYGISDSFRRGKPEMQLGITTAAETLGLSLQDLGRQVRQAFYGEEAQRIQRGRDDIRVMVRYPADQRRSLGDLENMRIRTPGGAEVPFGQVAIVEPGRGFASITRVNRNRSVNVIASVDDAVTSASDLVAALTTDILPRVLNRHPGVYYSMEGLQAEQQDSIEGLQTGFVLALFGIFALLAIPLKSYVQPLIIMGAIPFGLVGAIWGHIFLGLDVSLMSMFGLVALSGVVVNDSLIMVATINTRRLEHVDLEKAVRESGVGRFRPILLTSLTTFFGLVPLMLETSFQALFLIPMAVSLAFGVMFATLITLVFVPTAYLILDDIGKGMRRLFSRDSVTDDVSGEAPTPQQAGA